MEEVIVSVIIPVYNVDKYISRCLDSVINQTYKNLQIICVNDGSTDKSLEILNEYKQKDCRIEIISQRNLGLSEARNAALKNVKGKYVSFIDSDDWIDLDYYELLVDSCEKSNSDIAIAKMYSVQNEELWNKRKNEKKKAKCFFLLKDKEKIIRTYITGSVCDKLFSADLLKKTEVKFIKDRFYEDNIVLLQLTMNCNYLCVCENVAYYYFNNPKSISRDVDIEKSKKRDRDKLFMINEILLFCEEKKVSKTFLFEVKLFLIRTIAFDFMFRKSMYYKECVKLFGSLFMYTYPIISLFIRENRNRNVFLYTVYHKIKRIFH